MSNKINLKICWLDRKEWVKENVADTEYMSKKPALVGHRVQAMHNDTYLGPSSTADLCSKCFGLLKKDPTILNDVVLCYAFSGEGEPETAIAWEGPIDHPEFDWGGYTCNACGVSLKDRRGW